MRNVRIDETGALHCHKCGSTNMNPRRTTRAHLIGWFTLGIGALLTKKKLRCHACGAWNDTGNAKKI